MERSAYPRTAIRGIARVVPHGWLAALLGVVIAAGAVPAGAALPRLGAAGFALVAGLAASVVLPIDRYTERAGGLATYVLQASIVCLGLTVSVGQVSSVGGGALPVVLVTLAVAAAAALILGRLLGVRPMLRLLIGVGTGICGASAIAVVAGVVGAARRDVTFAITTIFVFNVAAVMAFPALGHALSLDQHAFGVWAGTAINDTSSVVAAGVAYGHHAEATGIIVKLVRVTALLPLALLLAWRGGSGVAAGDQRRRLAKSLWVLPAFVVAATLNGAGLVGQGARQAIGDLTIFTTALALALVGLSARVGQLRQTGFRPVVLGMGVWAAVAVSSLVVQGLSGHLTA